MFFLRLSASEGEIQNERKATLQTNDPFITQYYPIYGFGTLPVVLLVCATFLESQTPVRSSFTHITHTREENDILFS